MQIEQLVFNLVRNALDATTGRPVRVIHIVMASLRDRAEVEISVADNGPGLPGIATDAPFEPFLTTKRDGLGVGLAICWTIAEAHGGTLSAGRHPGGAVFRFTVPAASAEETVRA